MKCKFLIFLGFCFLSLIFLECSENGQEQIISAEENTGIKVYKEQVGEEYEVEENDTIRLKLKNNYQLCIESPYDSIAVIYDEEYMKVERIDGDTYLCKPQSAGTKDVLFLGYDKESGTKIQSIREVHFKISGYYENFYITENSYVVDVLNSEVTKYKILADLQSNGLPGEYGLFHFDYTGLKQGNFTYVESGKASIGGLFAVDGSNYQLIYNTVLELTIAISQTEEDAYELRQDLTGKYQLLYPYEEVEMVSLISIATRTGE